MNTRNLSIVLSVAYVGMCIFVILHNARYDLNTLLSAKYLTFIGLSLLVFVVLQKIIKEISRDVRNDF
jgi:hypothetical protein